MKIEVYYDTEEDKQRYLKNYRDAFISMVKWDRALDNKRLLLFQDIEGLLT